MNVISKSILAAAGVAASSTMIVVGSYTRDRVDLGGTNLAEAPIGAWVASKDNQNVPEGDYFYEISSLLKREYVEPIKDDSKLAFGAVRGMVMSLNDPMSLYMDPDEFQSFLRRREGNYEGIGAELSLELPPTAGEPGQTRSTVGLEGEMARPTPNLLNGMPRIPKVTVVAVVPGGPADKAGVKPGDVVSSIDGYWVWDAELIVRFRDAQRDWLAKKLDISKLNELRKEVREKTEKDLMPLKAREKLTQGTEGVHTIVWTRNGANRTTQITKAESKMPGLTVQGDTLRLPFVAGAAQRLQKTIEGKQSVTIDLTRNVGGDFGEMKRALAVIAPKGIYGQFVTQRESKPVPLEVATGNPSPPKIKLLVDSSTRGAALVFALGLVSKGVATTNSKISDTQVPVYDIVQLPDGSGYTLVTSTYKPTAAQPAARKAS